MSESKLESAAPKSLIIATAGHVDHGKTSLIHGITGIDTDRLAEEKQRGLTIVPGFAYLHMPTGDNDEVHTIGFVDVPGHTDFINNMLAGVAAVDAALLVVAADDGIMPQTREHLSILNFLNVSQATVALTKTDRCEESRILEVEEDIKALLSESSLANSPIFQVSNLDGSGLDELKKHLLTMLQLQNNSASDYQNEYFRFLIDRSFSVKGIGSVVTGTVRSGMAETGSLKFHNATSSQCKIRGIRLDETELQHAKKGSRAALNLNIDHKLLTRGDWILDEEISRPASRLDVSIIFTESQHTPRSSTQYHLFIGASHHVVTIRKLGSRIDDIYQLRSHEPVHALHGDRFIIRDPASQFTIAGGKVIDIFVPRKNRGSEKRLEFLLAMDQNTESALSSLIELQSEGVDLENFSICRNIKPDALKVLTTKLKKSGLKFVDLDSGEHGNRKILHNNFFDQYCEQILHQLKLFHSVNSNQQGISEPALSKAVDFSGSHQLFHRLLLAMQQSSSIKQTGTLLHLPGHNTSLSKEEAEFLKKVRPLLQKAGMVPPRTRELVEMTGIPLSALEKILKQSAKARTLIKVADNRYFLPETIMALAEFVEHLAAGQQYENGFSVIAFRDASGIGRNLSIEILEYFDHIGFTRRDGNTRFVRTDKENVFAN
jgi:selenocysteine-specific elongation factor